jgi:hypothetical protein
MDNQPQAASQSQTTPNRFYINQDFKIGRESFTVTDGQNVTCVAKQKLLAVKEHLDVYHDETATQLVFTIQQTSLVAISMTFAVVAANGQAMGSFRLQSMESLMSEHWEILDASGNPIGVIEQEAANAMLGRVTSIVPQTFVAKINGQPVCTYKEEHSIGMYFKMDIDFSTDTAGIFDRTLGIAGAILLASRHMQTK